MMPEEVSAVEEFDAELAAAKLKEGKILIDDDPEKAAELLGNVVQMYEKAHGRGAIECAEAYLQYGMALFEVARLSTDALATAKTRVDKPPTTDQESEAAGADVADGADLPEGTSAAAAQAPETEQKASPEKAVDGIKESGAEAEAGAAEPAADAAGDAADADDGEGKQEEGEENNDEAGEVDDMMVAWETLEFARVVYTKDGPEKHAYYLAEVYKGLGDIQAEQDLCEGAAECYYKSIACLETLEPLPKRRLAEVQYKLSLMLTFIDNLNPAMTQTRAALANLEGAVADIEDRLAALPTDGSGGEAAEQEGQALQATADDLRSVMMELQENLKGLQEAIEKDFTIKESIKQCFIKAYGGSAPDGGEALPAAIATTIATTLSQATGSGAPVAVVGRGTKRLNIQAIGPSGASKVSGNLGSASLGTAVVQAVKRTLADLMGGAPIPGAETASGFGAVALVEKRLEAQPQAKKARAEEPAGEGIVAGVQAGPEAAAAATDAGSSAGAAATLQ